MSQKMTNLEESPHFLGQSIELIERSFGYDKKYSYKDDFCILYQKENLKNCFLLVESDKVLATACLIPRKLSDGLFETPVCFIGGLCSHEDIRGQGVFKNFFQSVLDNHTKEYSLIMLWSELSDFYRKFDFFEAGSLYEYTKDSIDHKESDHYTLAKHLTNQDITQLKRLYKKTYQNCFTPLRSDHDWDVLIHHQSIDLYIEKDDSKIVNYFFANKGMDLKNIIHESTELVLPKNIDFKLWSPNPSVKAIKKYLAFIKLNDNSAAKDLISVLSNNEMELIAQKDNHISFLFKNEEFTLSLSEFITGIFGPDNFKEFSDFNTSIWIPGYESV